MENLSSFLSMGGYAAFVWPAYALTALVLGGVLVQSLRRLKQAERELLSLKSREGASGL